MDTVQQIAFFNYSAATCCPSKLLKLVTVKHALQCRLLLTTLIQHKQAKTTTAQMQQDRANPESDTTCIVQLYKVFQDDMPDDLRQLHNVRWEMVNVAERPNTIDDTIQEINPVLYLNMYTTVVILLVMSVSTATTQRSTARVLVGIGSYACSQGQDVGCRTDHPPVQ